MAGTASRVIRFLVDHAQCTDCGGDFRAEDVYVLDERNSREWDLGAVCHACHTLTLIRAVVDPDPQGENARPSERTAAETAEAATYDERTRAECRHFADLDPVGPDDVLDVSAFLADFDGDLRDLFGQESEIE